MESDQANWMRGSRRLAVAAFALSGTAALIYEVVWTRELTLVFGSTVYAVSMMLMTFMSGLSLGGWKGGKWADETPSLLMLYGKLELGIGVFAAASIPLIRLLPGAYFAIFNAITPSFGIMLAVQIVFSFAFMIVPTFLMGATFPVVAKLFTRSRSTHGGDIGTVYSINTLGSVLGSMAAGFILIPTVGIRATTLLAATLNVAVAIAMIARSKSEKSKLWLATCSLVLVAVVTAGSLGNHKGLSGFYEHFAPASENVAWEQRSAVVFHSEDVAGDVSVIKTGDDFGLMDGGLIEGSSAMADRSTTTLLAALPAEIATSRNTALTIGLGTGYTTQAMLSYPFKRVDTVEINRSIVDASRYFVANTLSDDARSKIHVTDGRNFLAASSQRYDVITSEPSWPLSTHVSHLFTKEFFDLERSRLSDGGVLCQWIPQYLLSPEDYQMMYKTFKSSFPNTYVWVNDPSAPGGGDFMFIGVNSDVKLDQAAITAKVLQNGLENAEFYPYEPNELEAQALSDPSIPLNTDDRPLLEFDVARNMPKYIRAARGDSTALALY